MVSNFIIVINKTAFNVLFQAYYPAVKNASIGENARLKTLENRINFRRRLIHE